MRLGLPLHDPAPRRVGREGEHASGTVFLRDQQRSTIRGDGERLRGRLETAEVIGAVQRRERLPCGAEIGPVPTEPQDRDAAEAGIGEHLERPLEVQAGTDRLVEGLPCEAVRLEGQQRTEPRASPATRLEGVESSEHADPRAATHLREDGVEVVGPHRRRVEVPHEEDVEVRGEGPAEIDGPAVPTRRVDPLEVHLHVGTRRQHASQEALLHARRTLDVEHPQAPVDDLDERGEFVVGEHHLAVLRLDAQRDLPLSERLWRPLEPHRLVDRLSRRGHAGRVHLHHASVVVLGEERDLRLAAGQTLEPHAPHHLQHVPQVDGLPDGEARHGRVASLPAAALATEGHAPQWHARLPDPAGRRLGRYVPRRASA